LARNEGKAREPSHGEAEPADGSAEVAHG
jgi:hypothetical protein